MTFQQGSSGNPAGRPKGSKNQHVLDEKIRAKLAQTGESPLEVMLGVMRDPSEKIELRLDAAKAAAPYLHRKMPIAVNEPTAVEPILLDELHELSASEREALLALLEKAVATSE